VGQICPALDAVSTVRNLTGDVAEQYNTHSLLCVRL
jgi:hypothetical protein